MKKLSEVKAEISKKKKSKASSKAMASAASSSSDKDDAVELVAPTPIMFSKRDFKSDKYSRSRGGESNMLQLFCGECDGYLITYQKDGPGKLLRCYLDRIHHPPTMKDLQKTHTEKSLENMECSKCDTAVAVPMTYESEDRLAYRLLPNKSYSIKMKI